MNEIIYNGLVLTSPKGCKYYKVVEGNNISLREDTATSTLILTYTPGCTTKTVSDYLGLERYGDPQEMTSMTNAGKFSNPILSLNGLRLKKLSADTYIFNMIIVKDSESRVIQDSAHTTIVISETDLKDDGFVDFLFYSGNLKYLQPVGPKPKCYKLYNFPNITIKDSDVTLTSESTHVFVLRRRYDDYVIREIEYIDQFILELRRILDNYGIELVRINKEETLKNTSYISYQITQTPTRSHHPWNGDEDRTLISCRLPIDFSLRTKDMVMFYDFKNKYNNLDILTNLTEFRTMDKYGKKWTAAVKWGPITEDFNHVYQSDDNSNFAQQCQFRCELNFYEMIDTRLKGFVESILYELRGLEPDEDWSEGVLITSTEIK